jgi:hypothetical protein
MRYKYSKESIKWTKTGVIEKSECAGAMEIRDKNRYLSLIRIQLNTPP